MAAHAPNRLDILCLAAVAGIFCSPLAVFPAQAADDISFYRDVRPILQRTCSGCHFAGKAGGQLLVTSVAGLQKGGEGGASVVAGKPDESLILDYITGEKPEMPRNGDPLPEEEIDLIRQWIAQGAVDDTPEGLEDTISPDNPPVYTVPPVVTALDYSPDGTQLAVSGYHEVLIFPTDGSSPPARLIGRSPRIESLSYSPDGSQLAVTGGAPGLFGEVQLWNMADHTLTHSITLSYDTLFGVSFNADGTRLAFGGADNGVRVIDTASGERKMQMDAHADWVFGTTFSLKNDHLISVSRDRSMKLSIVESGQFVDNITSITPGALKGGLAAVERHPSQEQILCGGADGEPKLYKIFREQARQIGDDFNRIRSYPKLEGRIFDVEFTADGSKFIAGASNATAGTAAIYETDSGKLLHQLPDLTSPVYAVSIRGDGTEAAAAGFDGTVRLYDVATGALKRSFEAAAGDTVVSE